jgi:TonB family protein
MADEPRKIPEESFGALGCCLVEGDAEQQARQRSVRRRSLTISVLLQAAVLVAVVLVPLFARTERIALANVTPVPPYSKYREATNVHPHPQGPTDRHRIGFIDFVHFSTTISKPRFDHNDGGEPDVPGALPGGTGPTGFIPIADPRAKGPERPDVDPNTPRTVHTTTIDPAMLKIRVEPVYPALMKQTRREGRVLLHAIIAEDGTIESLEAVGGDPMFYNSALEAVRQWVYKPTHLNGRAVQVDTTITVIYTMQH